MEAEWVAIVLSVGGIIAWAIKLFVQNENYKAEIKHKDEKLDELREEVKLLRERVAYTK